jgi:hypothetical protein
MRELTIKTKEQQDFLKEVAAYIRMRGLQVGIMASPAWPGRTNKEDRAKARAREDVLEMVADELEALQVEEK